MDPATLGAPIAKVASTAVGRVIGVTLGAAQQKYRRNKLVSELEDTFLTAESTRLVNCTPDEGREIAEFVRTPEFENIAIRVTMVLLRARRKKAEVEAFELIEYELRECIRLCAPLIQVERVYYFGTLLMNLLKVNADHSIANALAGHSLNDRATARALAAIPARLGSKENRELLGKIDSHSVISQFEKDMREQVRVTHAKMRLPHAGATRLVPCEDLFVEPNLRWVSPLGVDSEAPDGGGSLHANRTTLDALVSNSLRSVVLGDPGGGKSTLSVKLARDIAAGKATEITRTSVPFVVVLRDFASQYKQENKTIADYLADLCSAPYNITPPENAIEYLLSNGKAFIILDGLDELIDTSLRAQVVDAVHAFVNRYPTVHMLVTSRRIGYDQAPLDSDLFALARLGEFEAAQVEQYSENWFQLDETIPVNQKAQLTAAFVRDSRIVDDLRANPLMLSLMCGIYSVDGYIPRNRPDVYEKCATLLFESWDRQRDIHVPLLFDAHIKASLYALALWLYEDSSRQQGLTKEALIVFMRNYLHGRRFESLEDAENAATEFVNFCTGRAWVMTDVGSNPRQPLYGFTHRTFLEYFSAKQLVRQNVDPQALADKLVDRIIRAEWDVVTQLALQMTTAAVEDGADLFLDRLIDTSPGRSASERWNLALFMARSLGFVVPHPRLIKSIVSIAYDEVIKGAFKTVQQGYWRNNLSSPAFLIATLAASAQEILPDISKEFERLLRADVENGRQLEACLATALYLGSTVRHGGIESAGAVYVPEINRNHWRKVEADLREDLAPTAIGMWDKAPWLAGYVLARGYVKPSIILSTDVGRDGFFGSVYPLHRRLPLVSEFYRSLRFRDEYPGSIDSEIDSAALLRAGMYDDLVDALMSIPRPWSSRNKRGVWWIGGELHNFKSDMIALGDQGRIGALLLLGAFEAEALEAFPMNTMDTPDRRLDLFSASITAIAGTSAEGLTSADIVELVRSLEIRDDAKELLSMWVGGAVKLFNDNN